MVIYIMSHVTPNNEESAFASSELEGSFHCEVHLGGQAGRYLLPTALHLIHPFS